MPYDPNRRLYTPDFFPDMQQQGWVNMGDDDDPQIDIRSAVGAFKNRFMNNRAAAHSSAPEHSPTAPMMGGPMGHEGLEEFDMPHVMDGVDGGGAAAKKVKSL